MSQRPNPSPSSPTGRRFLETVVVCDGYGDFLEETLPAAVRASDRLVVVTSEGDKETRRLCDRLNVQCVRSWAHKRSGFDKAKAINHGLAHLACKDYLLHLDADVLLPDAFRTWFENSYTLRPNALYGVDRYDVRSKAELRKILDTGWQHNHLEWGFLISQPPGQPARRVGHGDYEGWLPIGYFQLWHGSEETRYPVKDQAFAERTDVLFASNWPPEDRILIPDFYVLHLSTNRELGANWKGRKSPRWK